MKIIKIQENFHLILNFKIAGVIFPVAFRFIENDSNALTVWVVERQAKNICKEIEKVLKGGDLMKKKTGKKPKGKKVKPKSVKWQEKL